MPPKYTEIGLCPSFAMKDVDFAPSCNSCSSTYHPRVPNLLVKGVIIKQSESQCLLKIYRLRVYILLKTALITDLLARVHARGQEYGYSQLPEIPI